MKVKDKILFLQESTKLNDKDFCNLFSLSYKSFCLFLKEKATFQKKELTKLVDYFHFDINDFVDESSTLLESAKEGEHLCKFVNKKLNNNFAILEDFGKEDNQRYEEKD